MAKSQYISIREAAKKLLVSENTVRRMFDKGELEGFRTPSGHRRLYRAAVLRLVRAIPKSSKPGLNFERGTL